MTSKEFLLPPLPVRLCDIGLLEESNVSLRGTYHDNKGHMREQDILLCFEIDCTQSRAMEEWEDMERKSPRG